MLDILFNDEVTVRRLAGPRDGHGKAALITVCEADSDVPLYLECFIDRTRKNVRTSAQMTKSVDAILIYNVGDSPTRLVEEDLLKLDSTGETYRVDFIIEQISSVEGSEYGRLGLARVKAAVAPNMQKADET